MVAMSLLQPKKVAIFLKPLLAHTPCYDSALYGGRASCTSQGDMAAMLLLPTVWD